MVDFAAPDEEWAVGDETSYQFPDDYDPNAVDDDGSDDYDPTVGSDFQDEVPDGSDGESVEAESDLPLTGGDVDHVQADPVVDAAPDVVSVDGIVVEEKAPVEPLYANVIEFVEQFFTQVIRRRLGMGGGEDGLAWDPRWALYPEVAGRLKALWYAYEEARASDNASAMSNWWIQHLEPHLRIILDGDTGPMAHAKADGSFTGWPALRYEPVPRELLADLLDEHPED